MATAALATPTLNPTLRTFWTRSHNDAGDPIRYRVLAGGRSSSKSWDAAGFAIFLAQQFRLKFMCVRQFQSNIEESVYSLLKGQIERFGLRNQFHITDRKIIHRKTRSEFIFKGIWRSIDEIKSTEGVDICWIEEAHNLTEAQWEILEPTLRKDWSQFWVIFNPHLSSDFVWKRFVERPLPGTIVRRINYDENPFLSPTIRRVIEAKREEDEDAYRHIYLGVPNDNDDDSVIKRSWIRAALVTREGATWRTTGGEKPLFFTITGSRRLGFDVADSGADLCATVSAHGSLVTDTDMWKAQEDELLKSCTRAWATARKDGAIITYDSIGVGAVAGAQFNAINATKLPAERIQHRRFNAGGQVWKPDATYSTGTKNKDMFANIKAQAWWQVADRFRNTYNAVMRGQKFKDDEMIFIDGSVPNLERLIDELATPKRDFDNAGRVKVESKADLAKSNREGGAVPSPNLADAFVMAFAPGMSPMKISGEALLAMKRA